MLDFVIGTKIKPAAVDSLMETLRGIQIPDGILYVGYPIVATDQDTSAIDALFTSEQFGVVIFDLLDSVPTPAQWTEVADREDRL